MTRPLLLLLFLIGCASPPTGLEVAISPAEPTTGDVLHAQVTAEAEAEGEVVVRWYWFEDGEARPDLDADTVPASETDAAEVWSVRAVPEADGLVGAAATAQVTIVFVPDADADGDGYDADIDCDDGDAGIYPGAPDGCDGIDSNCDPTTPPGDVDSDGDGVLECDGDCDDTSADVYPGNPLVECVPGSDWDSDCSDPDNGLRSWWVPDLDQDGDGDQDSTSWLYLCPPDVPDGYSGYNWIEEPEDSPGDCLDDHPGLHSLDADSDGFSTCAGDYWPGLVSADDEPFAYPGACEACDTIDNDLDGQTDEGYDMDGDGALADNTGLCGTNPYGEVKLCEHDPTGGDNEYLASQLDCDDGDATLNNTDADFDGVSTCNGDCNDGNSSITNTDVDGDGWTTCMVPPDCDDTDPTLFPEDWDGDGFTSCQGDCLDDPGQSGENVFPGNGVQCDGYWDTDCDGVTDPLESDDDGDGSTECDGDCDDSDPTLNGLDIDGDGWTTCEGDCDDADATVYPGAPALCDGITDNDCSGSADDNEADADADGSSICDGDCNDFDATVDALDIDGDGWTTCDGDCDDNDSGANPGVDADGDGWDVCGAAGVPADCSDTDPVLNWNDTDGDGASTCSNTPDCDDLDPALNQLDADSDGETSCDGDCNDASAQQRTSGSEGASADGLDNDCDGVADEGLIDPGDLAITEIMIGADPASGDGYAEYVEVINTSGTTIDLRGWEVEVIDVGAAATTSWTFPDGIDEEPLLVAPGERAVLARPTNDLAYGYDIADHHWSAPSFCDVGGEITLIFGVDVDWVGWDLTGCVAGCDSSSPSYAGAPYWRPGWAMGLKEAYVGTNPATHNDDLEKWCEEGDPVGPLDHGSPGYAPTVLGPCGDQ